MAIHGNGMDYDITCKLPQTTTTDLDTSTSQYLCVYMCGDTATADRMVDICGADNSYASSTEGAFSVIGINQTAMLSATSQECSVRIFGISKAKCAESVPAGAWVMPYFGVSTTTRLGQIVTIDNGVSAGGHSITVHCAILGRALENGSTNTVISVFVNPQLYDWNLVGTIGIT